jgi:hypothetical protein
LVKYAGLVVLVRNSAAKRYASTSVCDMLVKTATPKLTSQCDGENLYFWAPGRRIASDQDPEKYLVRSLQS